MLTTSRLTWIAVISVALLVCSGCSYFRGQSMLPAELSGTWTTDDARYQGRFLELYPTFVILYTGADDTTSVQWIERVESEPFGSDRMFTVYSTDHDLGSHDQLSFQFSTANGGELHFKNQSQVWKRGFASSRQ